MNSAAYIDDYNYYLLEENNKIPQNLINDLKNYNLEPINTSYIENYWIADNFSFILCNNIIDNKTYFYIFNHHNNNELIDIILNKYEENKNIKSKYYCYFEYNNIGYYIVYHLFVLFNQFIIHKDTKEEFENETNKEYFINCLLKTFKFH